MRPIVSVTICTICLGAVAGCSLNKPSNQSSQNAGSQVNSNQTSVATTTSTSTDAHPSASPTASSEASDELHAPEKGSPERQAIMDALRGGDEQTQFQVHYIKVHNGWCWVDTTPLDKNGRATAEGGPNLLHLENGVWKVKDLSKVPDDPNDPLGAEDASPGYIKNVMKTFPGVPRDIFPKSTN